MDRVLLTLQALILQRIRHWAKMANESRWS
jgi:hypothetical protein